MAAAVGIILAAAIGTPHATIGAESPSSTILPIATSLLTTLGVAPQLVLNFHSTPPPATGDLARLTMLRAPTVEQQEPDVMRITLPRDVCGGVAMCAACNATSVDQRKLLPTATPSGGWSGDEEWNVASILQCVTVWGDEPCKCQWQMRGTHATRVGAVKLPLTVASRDLSFSRLAWPSLFSAVWTDTVGLVFNETDLHPTASASLLHIGLPRWCSSSTSPSCASRPAWSSCARISR